MAVSWQNERTIELTVMIGTMLQDELNAITVGIFLQVESGYMTWLNYGLLDTLSPWSHGGAHGGAASAPYLRRRRTQVHMGLYQQAWLGVDVDPWQLRAGLCGCGKHSPKTR